MRNISKIYWNHRYMAQRRGIPFLFTQEEWVTWWISHLGPDWRNLRGRRRGQYVMARMGDKGAYEHSNVKCVSVTINHAERGKLTEDQVRAIRQTKGRCLDIGRQYGVSGYTISVIRSGKGWKHVK